MPLGGAVKVRFQNASMPAPPMKSRVRAMSIMLTLPNTTDAESPKRWVKKTLDRSYASEPSMPGNSSAVLTGIATPPWPLTLRPKLTSACTVIARPSHSPMRDRSALNSRSALPP